MGASSNPWRHFRNITVILEILDLIDSSDEVFDDADELTFDKLGLGWL